MESMTSITSIVIYLTLGALALLAYRKRSVPSLRDVPGPPADSYWLGNLLKLFHYRACETDFHLQAKYGSAVRLQGALGGSILWTCDPKALQHMYKLGYKYYKAPERRPMAQLLFGHGLSWAEGSTHKRQRTVLNPAFSPSESKAAFPTMSKGAGALAEKLEAMLLATSTGSMDLNIAPWLSRATLDVIGEAGFNYHFGSLNDEENELAKAYNNMMPILFGRPTAASLFIVDISRFLPVWFMEWFRRYRSSVPLERSRHVAETVKNVAIDLIEKMGGHPEASDRSRDAFSLILKANASHNEKSRLDEEETYDSFRTILLGGHETVTNTLSFGLLELARSPAVQSRLRAEIRDARANFHSLGKTDLSVSDLDVMPYLQAVTKEILRLHPVLPYNYRVAAEDDVLPLATPIRTKSGKVLHEIPIARGTRIVGNPDVWGSDAHTFNPDLWLDGRVSRSHSIGVYSNLASFSGGVRACLGWRFAVYELQAFLIELVSNFELAPSKDDDRIRREFCTVMVPMLEGDKREVCLPLKLSLVAE